MGKKKTVPLLEDLALSVASFPLGVAIGAVWSWLANPVAIPGLIHNYRKNSTRNFHSFCLHTGGLCGYIGGTYSIMYVLTESESPWKYLPLITNAIGMSALIGTVSYDYLKRKRQSQETRSL
ncbi:MAG: hypothetical protein AABY00_03690 [Nanoarchaeota archaeon]